MRQGSLCVLESKTPLGMAHLRPPEFPKPYAHDFDVKRQTSLVRRLISACVRAERNRDRIYNKTAIKTNIRGHRF